MKFFSIMICLTLIACATEPKKNAQYESDECLHYRSMMTAPMAPDALKQLQNKCEESKKR